MPTRSNFVNLDAMFPRADFALIDEKDAYSTENQSTLGLRDLSRGALMLPNLRKPDFQRETNHWEPEQVASLVQSFMEGDLIPAVILWRSPTYVFVIDGGHRLSALRAWVEDDYGDRHLSRSFFINQITKAQLKAAQRTRELIDSLVGSYEQWKKLNDTDPKPVLEPNERRRLNRFSTGTIPIQWVIGDVEKAESSFFKINKQGTPLDEVEELLLRNRHRPIPIAARSIIRAGEGHQYASAFDEDMRSKIRDRARRLYTLLFEPEHTSPLRTLDLPLGGNAGVRAALSLLIDLILIANRNQQGKPIHVADDQPADLDGHATVHVLDRTLRLIQRMTGNEHGSLGLHPAVYFYSTTGRFAPPLFMAMARLIATKLIDNDQGFFERFTRVRHPFEELLVSRRALFTTLSQQISSRNRYDRLAGLFDYLIAELSNGITPDDNAIVSKAGLRAAVLVPKVEASAARFSEGTKSAAFLREAIRSALRCPICNGYLDTSKSVSYDHLDPVRSGGKGDEDNCQLTHPYCNQSVKQ